MHIRPKRKLLQLGSADHTLLLQIAFGADEANKQLRFSVLPYLRYRCAYLFQPILFEVKQVLVFGEITHEYSTVRHSVIRRVDMPETFSGGGVVPYLKLCSGAIDRQCSA